MEDLRDLRLFLHVTETLNFGRSSAESHVSPATLTRAIQRLESRAGRRLLERGPRGVSITADGLRFREYARGAVELWDRYRADEPTGTGLQGQVSIFATVTACQAILPDLIRPFRTAHPDVRLDLTTGDAAVAIARVDEGSTDLALAAIPARVPGSVVSRVVTETSLEFIAPARVGRADRMGLGGLPVAPHRAGPGRGPGLVSGQQDHADRGRRAGRPRGAAGPRRPRLRDRRGAPTGVGDEHLAGPGQGARSRGHAYPRSASASAPTGPACAARSSPNCGPVPPKFRPATFAGWKSANQWIHLERRRRRVLTIGPRESPGYVGECELVDVHAGECESRKPRFHDLGARAPARTGRWGLGAAPTCPSPE